VVSVAERKIEIWRGRSALVKAFLMFTVESGSEDKVLRELRKSSFVEEAYVSYGVYDVIAKMKADSLDQLKKAISSELQRIVQIQTHLTLVMIED
jgi:DNA-binding Lrp family transcriptional regulator